jgi:hypothetical protein
MCEGVWDSSNDHKARRISALANTRLSVFSSRRACFFSATNFDLPAAPFTVCDCTARKSAV